MRRDTLLETADVARWVRTPASVRHHADHGRPRVAWRTPRKARLFRVVDVEAFLIARKKRQAP